MVSGFMRSECLLASRLGRATPYYVGARTTVYLCSSLFMVKVPLRVLIGNWSEPWIAEALGGLRIVCSRQRSTNLEPSFNGLKKMRFCVHPEFARPPGKGLS
jgi:hypothetical protein